jgi:hypothetical protein
MNTATTPQDDLSFLRSLAVAGRDAPLQAGPYLVAGGGWFAMASLLLGLQALGVLALPAAAMWSVWLVAMVGFSATLFLLIRHDSQRVANTTNAVIGAAWSAAGWGIFAFFVAVYIVAARTDSYAVLNTVAPAVLVLYGVCWKLSAEITRQRWMNGVTALTFVALLLVAASIGTRWTWIAYAVALVLSGVLPGLYLMRLARAARATTAAA